MKNSQNTKTFVSNILFGVHSFDLIVGPFSHASIQEIHTIEKGSLDQPYLRCSSISSAGFYAIWNVQFVSLFLEFALNGRVLLFMWYIISIWFFW